MSRQVERAPTPRQLKVGEELRHALAWVLERGEIRDPGLGAAPITVTEVRVSPDLRHATAFVIPLGASATAPATKAALEALTRAAPFLRHQLSRRVRLKFMPEFVFRADTTFAEAERIGTLLNDPAVRRDLSASGQDDDGAA
jgi:ribosome-binding factor A